MRPTDTVKTAFSLPFKAIGYGTYRLFKDWALTDDAEVQRSIEEVVTSIFDE